MRSQNMKRNKLISHSLFSIVIFIFGCAKMNGTSTGNPLITMTVTGSSGAAAIVRNQIKGIWNLFLEHAFALPPPTLVDSQNSSVTLNQFWINISNIEIKATQVAGVGEVNGSEIEFIGPFSVDLLTSSPQSLGLATLLEPNFQRIKYKLAKLTSSTGSEPAGLLNESVYINASIRTFSFQVKISDEVETETGGPNQVSVNQAAKLLLQIQTGNLFKKINLSGIIASNTIIDSNNRLSTTSACPLIDASLNDVYSCFLKGLGTESNFGKDDNNDNQLNPTEAAIKL